MRGSSEWKIGQGQLRVVTIAVHVSKEKCGDPLGVGSLSGHCAGLEA